MVLQNMKNKIDKRYKIKFSKFLKISLAFFIIDTMLLGYEVISFIKTGKCDIFNLVIFIFAWLVCFTWCIDMIKTEFIPIIFENEILKKYYFENISKE